MLKRFSEITMNDVATCGGKGASLGEMMNAGLPIPNGFVLTTEAYGKNSKEWEKEVLQAFDKLNTKFVAVRSSGTKEDGADDSFAGQFDTYLFVTRENLIAKIKECHDSVNSERIISYCEYKGIDIKSIKVAVVIQKMVNSDSAGVCFTVNPVSQNYAEIMIDAGFGVGEAVVSGMITPDNYIVNKKTWKINKVISQQEKKLVLSDKGGTKEVDILKEEQNNQKLSDKHIQELAKLAKKIEQHYGKPMDTEWAIENGELFMLQARPITTLIKNGSLVDKFVSSLNDKDNLLPPITTSSIFVQACIELYANHMPHYIKDNTPMNGLSLYHDGKTYTYIDGTKLINITNAVIKLFFSGNLTSDDVFNDFNQYANQIDYDYKHYNYEYLKNLSNKKLFELANKTINSFLDFDAISLFAITVDENSLEKYFTATNQVYNLPKNFYKYASNIPTLSFDKKQIEDIISCIKNGGLNKENLEKLQYLGTSYSKYTSIEYMEDFLLDNYGITPDFEKDETIKLKKEKERIKKLKKEYDTWYLTLTSQQQLLASFIRMSIEFRDKRKNYTLKALCTISRIMEIFFDKNGLNKKYLWNVGFGEILSGPDYILELKDKLALREQGSVFFSDYNQQKLLIQEGYEAFSDAFEKIQSLYNTNTQGNIIQGISGSSGKAKGIIKVIQFLDKDNQFQDGDILVTGMTRPEFVPLMKKASAIITDEGGITCHAAIVSRELGIPCVIGTKIATQVLKDGDLVEVDADNGIVKIEKNKTSGSNSLDKPPKQKKYTIYPAGDFNTSFISNYSVVLGYTKFPKLLGLPICDGPHVVRNGDLEYIFDMSTWDACERSIVEKMDKDINYIDNLTDKIMGEGKNLCERIQKKSQNPNLKKLKNEELLKILEEFIEYQSNIYAYGTSFNFIGYGEDNYITKNLNKIFKEKNIPEGKINEVMEIFTYPYKDSFSQQQKIEILELLNKYINKYKKDFINDCKNKDLEYIQKKYSDFFEELKSHSEKYSRLSFGFTGPASNISDFFNDIKKIISDKVSINDRLESIKNKRIDNEKKKKFWMNKLNPNKNEKLLLETAGKIVRAKPTRKDYQSQAYCLLEPIIIEISNRLQTDTSTVWQMSISNMREFLKGKYDSNLQAKFQSFYICVPKNPEKVDVLTGENAHEFYDDNVLIEKDGIDVQDNVIHGNTACNGSAKGVVKIINSKNDMSKMETGNILVSVATSPSIVAAMKKAAAIITDSGGLTCHAAIVSRELGIPCVIGTKIATQVLKDGDLVEVDADNGIIKILENESKGDKLEVKIGNKTFTPESRSHPEVYFNFQAYPFFTSIFAKCYSLKERKWSTPCLYVSEFNGDGHRAIQYCTGSFIEKGKNMIDDLLSGGNEASKFLEKNNKLILNCFNECKKYLKNKNGNFLEIWDKIGTAFSEGRHIFNFSYAMQEYLNNLKSDDPDLFEKLSSNIIAPEKSFINQAEDYLIELCKKYPKNFDKVYEMFMEEYGRFQNSYLGINKKTTKSWLKEFYEKIKNNNDNNNQNSNKSTDLPKKYKLLVETAGRAVCYQDNKKRLGSISYIIMENRLRELSKEIKISFDDLLWLTVEEILSYDLKSKTDIKRLKERISKYKNDNKRRGVMTNKGYIDIDESFRLEVVKLNNKEIDGNTIHGIIGNKGKIIGRARIVLNIEKDAEKVNEGDILVTGMTRPEFVPIMRKAGAFITDEGGVTCHAAIISRELGKPCIIGTKIATQVLKDGDLVEVDADNGIVKVLENEDNNLEVKIGNKTFTPEFRKHENTIHFSYQGVPFFSCIFSKCCTTNDTDWTTPANYICEFNNLETTTQYVIGDFVEKGENIIETMIKGKKDASIFLKKQDEIVLKCIKKCDKYIRDGKTNFLDIRNEIKLAFEAGCHVINLSYALQKYLENLNKTNQKLYKNISENINAPKKSFVNEAGDYLKKLMQKYPDNFEKVYNEFMIKYGWFQNSYLGIKHIDKKRLKEYAEELSKTPTSKASKKKTKIEKKYSQLVETASNAIIYQDNKKRLGFMSMQIMENRLRNYSKKIKIPYNYLLWLTVEEIIENDEKTIKDKINEYKQTGKRICIMTEKGYTDIPEEFWLKVTELNKPQNDIKSFNGITGCKGKYTGSVKIISNIEKDKNKFKKGDILVTGMTRPEFVPLIKKAGGIITNEGGITCHAAIISRELGIPCIIGTKIATQVLKDGDLVEVDADNGIVKILENTNGEKETGTRSSSDLTKKFNELKRYNQRDIQTFNAYPFFINSVATVSAFNLLPYDLHYTQILCEYENDTVKWHYNVKDYENLGKIFWGKCKSTNELLKLIDKYDIDYRQSEKEFDKALSIYKKNKSEDNRTRLLEKSVKFLACGAGSAHILECASYYAEKYFTKGKIITPHDESFLSKAHKLAKKLKSEYDLKKAYKEFLKEYGRIKNTYLGRNMISIQEFSDLADEKDLRFTAPKYKKNSIEEMISYTFNRQDRRKENIFKAIEKVDEVLNQISKDTGINKKSLSYMLPNEVSKINNKDFQEELENRELYFIDYTTKKEHYFSSQHIDEQKNEEKLNELKEIKGSIGNPGKVTGTARICQNLESIKNFNEGEILVTSMTRPEFITAMRKASAFVTDEGGITCHAAIISRELGKPCIIGTKIATKVLKDGDFIEVDADNGVVKILQ